MVIWWRSIANHTVLDTMDLELTISPGGYLAFSRLPMRVFQDGGLPLL